MANNITRWNPWRDMVNMQNAMDKLFEDTWRNLETRTGNWLALDVHEDNERFTVSTDLPGVAPENIHIHVQDGLLTIEAEIPEQTVEQEGTRSLIRERRYGRFTRTVQLPHSVNSEGVEATYDNGVLTLDLPKVEEAKPRSIPVKPRNMISSNN